jgi:hypothetical protein
VIDVNLRGPPGDHTVANDTRRQRTYRLKGMKRRSRGEWRNAVCQVEAPWSEGVDPLFAASSELDLPNASQCWA